MNVESDTTITVTLAPGEVKQAVLDWVRRNYQGSEAPRLTIRGVDFRFEYEDHECPRLNDWPEEIMLVCGVQQPRPDPPAKRPAGKRRPRAAVPAEPKGAPPDGGRCGSHYEGTEDFRGSDY